MASLSHAAGFLYSALQTAERTDGSTFLRLTSSAPSWASDAIREAHLGELPNDSRYAVIKESLALLQDGNYASQDAAIDDLMCFSVDLLPTYTSDLLNWFAAHTNRLSRCDDAMADGRVAGSAIYDILSEGFRTDCEDMLAVLISTLEDERQSIFNPDTDCRLILADAYGIYIPQMYVSGITEADCEALNVDWADVQTCQAGPDQEHYWDAWMAICDSAEWNENGDAWHLVQNGDLFAVRADAEIPEDWFC